MVEVFASTDAGRRHPDLVQACAAAGVPWTLVGASEIAGLCQTVTPQGVVAVVRMLEVDVAELVARRPELVAVLVQVRDPGNAGTVMRTADAAGAGGVVLTGASVDPYNGKCVRATAGSLFHLPVVLGASPEQAAVALRAAGLRVLAADARGDRDIDELTQDATLAGPTAWLFGNEAWGLPGDVVALADEVVRIPIYGQAESLNLASAAAVALYASARAQRAPSPVRP